MLMVHGAQPLPAGYAWADGGDSGPKPQSRAIVRLLDGSTIRVRLTWDEACLAEGHGLNELERDLLGEFESSFEASQELRTKSGN